MASPTTYTRTPTCESPQDPRDTIEMLQQQRQFIAGY